MRRKPPKAAILRHGFGLEAVIAVAMLATALAIVFEDALTRRTLTFGPAGAGRTFYSYVYGDESNGGTSKAREAAPLDWACTLTNAYQHKYCGFGLQFDVRNTGHGLNLSSFETLRIRLRYDGPGEFVRLVVKDRDPKGVRPGKDAVDKPIQTTIAAHRREQTVTIKLGELAVAEWWRDQIAADPENARPSFGDVISMEFVTASGALAGEHRLRVREITFESRVVGTGAWYGMIGSVWMLLIAAILMCRRGQDQRLKRRLADNWRTTLDTIPQMVWSYDHKGRFHFNARWEDFTGIRPCRGQGLDPWSFVHPEDRPAVADRWQHSVNRGEPYECEYRARHRSGEYRWLLSRAVPSHDESGAIVGWYGTCTDVHERVVAQRALKASVTSEREKSEELKWASEHDALTSLPNRRSFQARLQAATLRAMEADAQIGLLLIDLDHFKHVNDSFGHAAGDDLLQAISGRIRGSVRDGDFVARIGGDEFAIILEGVRSDEDLTGVGDAVFAAVRAPLAIGKRVLSAGASIGGALFPKDAATANDLFKTADTALYALKSSGRGGTLLFHGYMMEQAERAASQLGLAREVIGERKLIAHYQPKVDIASSEVVGFEALLRWHHPINGLQYPETLEEAFKDYELAARIGDLMQRTVARDIRGWLDRGLDLGRVSINAAPAEFLRDDYAERFLTVLMEANVPPEAVEVEVTEHAFMERGREFVARALASLQHAGVTVSLDDFGTGYSSLSHLRDFPVDRVKIDMSFIQQMIDDQEIAAIVAAVINLARSLAIDVVAEGVETQPQLELLRSMGCHLAQGHLFGMAIEPARVADMTELRSAA